MTLIGLLVVLIVIGLIFYAVQLLPIPQPFKNIVVVVLLLIVILFLLGAVGLIPMGDLRIS